MLAALNLQPVPAFPLWLGAAAAIGLLMLWAYLPQASNLALPWRVLLPGMRIGAVAVLTMSLLRPTVTRMPRIDEQGAVVFLLDRSRSMGVCDSGRPALAMDLAEALGAIPREPRGDPYVPLRANVDRLRGGFQALLIARGEVDYARLSNHGVEEADARFEAALGSLRDASGELADAAPSTERGAAIAAQCAQLTGPLSDRREGWVRQTGEQINRIAWAIEQARNAWVDTLLAGNAELRNACEPVMRLSRLKLCGRALAAPKAGILAGLDPDTPIHAFTIADESRPLIPRGEDFADQLQADGARSDLIGGMRQAMAQLAGQNVRAIVLFSDGRQVGGTSFKAPTDLGAPVFAVQCGRGNPHDLSIRRVSIPETVYVGETATVHVEVRAGGTRTETVDVAVSAGGATQCRRLRLAEEKASADFPIKFAHDGVERVLISLSPEPGEITSENNRVERLVKVVPAHIRVALAAGSDAWDVRYLRQAMEQTAWISLESQIVRDGDPAPWRFPDAMIGQQSVVVLSDISPQAIDARQWSALHAFVHDRGGSLVLHAGADHLPAKWANDERAADFLPYAIERTAAWNIWPGEETGYTVAPAAGADALRLSDDPSESRRRWAQLPALYRYLKLPPALKPGVRPLVVERESNDPIITEQRIGSGRVFFVATDETWRWRDQTDERDHDRLWSRLIRYAAEQPYAAHAEGVSLDLDRVSTEPGVAVHMRARLLDEAGLPLRGASPSLRVEHADGSTVRVQSLSAAADGTESGRLETTIADLPAGEYRVRLVVAGVAGTPSLPLSVGATSEQEMADLSPDEANLRRLAEATGGEYLRLDQIAGLPGRLAASASRRAVTPIEYRLWESPYLFVLIFGGLCLEWAIRKRAGLL